LEAEISELRAKLARVQEGIDKTGHTQQNSFEADSDAQLLEKKTEVMSRAIVEQSMTMNMAVRDLKKLQREMLAKPSEEKLTSMVEIIKETFKRQLGENVVGLKMSVNQVLKAVEKKAGREEVLNLIQSSIREMETNLNTKEEIEPAALGVKCLSCGHTARTSSDHTSFFTDDITDEETSLGGGSCQSANSGLRSLMPHQHPMVPRQNPFHTSRNGATQEPLYRRARAAAAVKESNHVAFLTEPQQFPQRGGAGTKGGQVPSIHRLKSVGGRAVSPDSTEFDPRNAVLHSRSWGGPLPNIASSDGKF